MATQAGLRRAARKAAVAAGRAWNVELNQSGQPVQVRERTQKEERRHERAMDRWARRMDADPDWR